MSALASLRTHRARVVGAITVAVAIGATTFLPLFGAPGYEHSLATGLLVPTLAAIVAALEAFADHTTIRYESPLRSIRRGASIGASFAAIALAAAIVHGAFIGFCDLAGGLETFALTAFAGSVLGGVAGSTWALIVAHVCSVHQRRRRLAVAAAALTPLTTALVDVWLFYATPAVFSFDPFVGFFSGTLYDEVVDAQPTLLTYRAGTLLTLLAIVLAASAFDRGRDGRCHLTRRLQAVSALAIAVGSLLLIAHGEDLGHRTSAAHIERVLGGKRSGARCDVVYPRGETDAAAALMVRDCEEQLGEVEAKLGVRGPDRVTAFFFHDAAQKRALMGAADTYIAKPWRREVYLQLAAYPHPVLGHELAHVVAGAIARGPFRVAGMLDGLLPNPGLIEGVAVAASPDRDELTPRAWSRAMRDLGLLPPLSSVFGAEFFAQNASTAYTVAGAFIAQQLDEGRGAAVRAWYAGASFDAAFGHSFADAERAFLASLDGAPLSASEMAVARARFDRPAIWRRRCPHVVERLRQDAAICRNDGDLPTADADLHKLLRLDEADPSARIDLARDAAKKGDFSSATTQLTAVAADDRLPTTWRARALETLGDEAVRDGHLDEARARYLDAAARILDEDWRRNLDVKAFACTSSSRADLVGRMLVPPRQARDESLLMTIALTKMSVATVDEAHDARDVALARYLLGRRLFDAKLYNEADAMLGTASTESLMAIDVLLVRELLHLRVLTACMADASVRADRATIALEAYEKAPHGNEGRLIDVERTGRRCGAR